MLRYRAIRLAMICAACGIAGEPGARAAAPESPAAESGARSAQPSGNPLWSIPLRTLTATRDRPIFSPSRRPPLPIPPAPVVVASPAPPPASAGPEQIQLTLLGTIVGGENGIAICLNRATNEVVRLKTGESFEGWALLSVHGREATLEKASQRTVLALRAPDDPHEPAPSPPQVIGAVANGTWLDGDGQLIAPPPKSK